MNRPRLQHFAKPLSHYDERVSGKVEQIDSLAEEAIALARRRGLGFNVALAIDDVVVPVSRHMAPADVKKIHGLVSEARQCMHGPGFGYDYLFGEAERRKTGKNRDEMFCDAIALLRDPKF